MKWASRYVPEALVLLTLVLAPVVLNPLGFSTDLLTRVLNWGLIGLGFDILFGLTGLLSFGQAAFYGVGGFVTAYLLVSGAVGSVWLALLVGTASAGVFGLVVGWFAVRRIGIYFTMITLAFGQMAYFIENSPLSDYTGGENGIPGVPAPTLGFGADAFRISAGLPMYVLFAVIFFLGYVLARRIVRSPVGAILLAIKENTGRVAMLGHDVPAYKLTAFVIAALYAGLAGGLLGSFQSYMPPDAFSLETSGQLVVQTIVGGAGTLIGPLVGAAVWLWLRDNLQLIPGFAMLWKLVLGIAFIVLVIGLRRGVCGEIVHWWSERTNQAALRAAEARTEAIEAHNIDAVAGEELRRRDVALSLAEPATGDGEVALEARSLARYYGGLRAVDGVSFKVRRGSIHAVIGPNGAGKSTLFKMLLDEISPSSGEVLLFGERLTGVGVSRAAQRGVAKSNQLNQLFPNLSVRNNLRIAALARGRGPLRFDLLRPADSLPDVEAQIAVILDQLNLVERADTPAHVLAYGEKRRLEIGMALATSPNVLLLDEPLAGMSPAERAATCAFIRDIARARTVVIVEHDLDAIFGLAERITVLYEGRLLADGTADEVRRNPAVQEAYLGGLHAHESA
ncbi:Vitamin B12 import ATP-binding protein BtuD [Rhodopseudomonas palustris]|uniref:Branched-chain amino acid ABC transporter ATP-binding protein/permease n=1 Tax=Rhodopseudomonas palustris (strain ATCC BAA-98 / CGA009) TaxID=258594 RepID=Q6N9I3_RHOPA|nr:branched-chain amino acid ABC transporter ATP-binding protein/permease [Rhodopseudomonas palustris]OPF91213.1 branched-chain amino acid ABC transporter permease/ATP-binding protein [Rhodopseudomonas palustris]QQM03068.1 Vitamin B12 import ATP-binding protein BtuD [Rhodopseudomonas palustris]RJF60629.1 ATP-binding cassette domain-containing protein [Rhodopseudomonas palustris]WAB79235.1 branched-chain amino acid ABC transporter ATP-binding protein/permease [Rhodopseudomonas palustris]WCL9170